MRLAGLYQFDKDRRALEAAQNAVEVARMAGADFERAAELSAPEPARGGATKTPGGGTKSPRAAKARKRAPPIDFRARLAYRPAQRRPHLWERPF